tara:strand:- start:4292 stop:5137 length:846 start_codon:yes stop_codon:yes gene_type:complete
MINIIGLGKTGCSLADEFSKHGQYDIYRIGIDLPKNKRSRGMKKQKTPEAYEEKCPTMRHFFKELTGRSILLVNGGEPIAAATLRVLEHCRPWSTSVVYIQPDESSLNETLQASEKVIFNVLQEYARSGAISKMILVDTKNVEEAMGDVPIIGYEEVFNQYIASSLNLINYFEHSEPVLSVDSEGVDWSRIMTISMISLEEKKEHLFFNLDNIREKMYFCGINEDQLRNDNKLLSKLKSFIDSQREGDQRTSYRVYSTTYEEPHVFCVQSSAMIQKRSKGA